MVCLLVFVVVVVDDVVVDGGGGGGSGGGVLFWSLREEAIPFQTTSEILIRSLFPPLTSAQDNMIGRRKSCCQGKYTNEIMMPIIATGERR